jgi:hypothetical protein
MRLNDKKIKYPEEINLLLEWFEKEGEAFIGEELISGFPAKKAHKTLGITDKKDHFICNGYPIDAERAAIFQKYVTHIINLDKYDYFIGGIADEAY